MDDDGSKNLDYGEFRKGIRDYGISLEEDVSLKITSLHVLNMCRYRYVVNEERLPFKLLSNE